MKEIEITITAIVKIPDKMTLGRDINGLPYYIEDIQAGDELHPALSFEKHGLILSPDNFECEVLEISTTIKEIHQSVFSRKKQ